MIKKHFNKIFIFIAVFVIVFSCFIINSSALDSSRPMTFSLSQPSLGAGDGYLEILMKNSSGQYNARVFQWHIDFDEFHSSDSDTIASLDDMSMLVTVTSDYVVFNFPYLSSYWSTNAYIFSISSTGSTLFKNFSSSDNGQYKFDTSSSFSIVSAHIYGNGAFSVSTSSSSISSEQFYCIYSSDVVEYNQLLSVISIITQLEANDQTIISKLQTIINNTDTIESKLQSALNLLTTIESDLDDVNAELDRIESNTDNLETQLNTIINILDNKNQETPKPDTSTTDDYNSKEQQLIGGTSAGRDEANSVFSDVNTTLSDNVGRGLLAVSSIMNEFISISWLSSLLKFSLALGMFGFILGMGFFLVSRSASHETRSNAKESNRYKNGGNN